MDRKQMCVTNVKYKKPTQHEAKRMKNLLGYLTYRDGCDEVAPQISGTDRWMDHGIGGSVAEIADRCDAYQSEHVLLFSIVVNPNPDLIRMMPHDQREQFVRQLTTKTIDDFFGARGIDTGVEWSGVLHHRQTDGDESAGQHNPHMHVVLPGTYYDADEGRRKPLYFSQNKSVNHIDMLHEVTQENMVSLMHRFAGRDWEHRYDQLAEIRQQQERAFYGEVPHGTWDREPVWAGVRRVDEDTTSAGVYGYFANREGKRDLQFRAIVPDLDHEEAEITAELIKEKLKREARKLERNTDPVFPTDIDF